MRPLTEELEDQDSPVGQFLDRRFTRGLPDVQRRYRAGAPALAVPDLPWEAADLRTCPLGASTSCSASSRGAASACLLPARSFAACCLLAGQAAAT